MRFIRLGAIIAWLAVASLAIAGFAAFSPARTTATPQPAQAADAAPVTSEAEAPTALGSASGRVAAMTFAAPASEAATAFTVPERSQIEALAAAAVTTTPAVAPAPTSSAPSTSVSPTTTAPAADEPATTTTVPPTTEPPPTTSPPVTEPPAIYIPPGTEPWVGLVEASFAAADVPRALMVIYCESNGDPNATNASSGAAGLFQHLPRFWAERSEAAGWAGADIYDPAANVAVAAWLVYSGGGWSHWNPSAHCWG